MLVPAFFPAELLALVLDGDAPLALLLLLLRLQVARALARGELLVLAQQDWEDDDVAAQAGQHGEGGEREDDEGGYALERA